MLKKVILGAIGTISIIIVAFIASLGIYQTGSSNSTPALATLPSPELSEGMRGELGIDKNINESTIDQYLDRPDTVYRDLRMFKDPGNYEAIDGDSYLSGIIKGFEVVPYPYIATPEGLPEAVGDSYTGSTLFSKDSSGNYVANYAESMDILETLFPQDKYIFLMCGGGGYSGMLKNLLISLGWDGDKIYDIGGYWYYNGNNKVEIKTDQYGDTSYAFWKVPYHNIDFTTLHHQGGQETEQGTE